jgi:DNA-directed RNA polymerase subunit RPC12/RpoP
LHGGLGGPDAVRPDKVGRVAGSHAEQQAGRSARLAAGTLACPRCDAPVALMAERVSPSDALECPLCRHRAAVRDFLSLAVPSRPARVQVRVLHPARTAS